MQQDYVTKNEFKASMNDIGQNFKAVFNKLDEHDEYFERIERRFEAVDLRFNRLEENMSIMNSNTLLIVRHLGITEGRMIA